MKNEPKNSQNESNQFKDENKRNEEFPGLEQPNLYHFNINNETEEQAVSRLDAQIRVCMRQYTITAIRDRGLELPDVTYMMKMYMKLVGQELRARELSIKERQLALRERAMAVKEGQAGKASVRNQGDDDKGISAAEFPSPVAASTSASGTQSPPPPNTEANKPSETKAPLTAGKLTAAKKIIEPKNAPKEVPYPDIIRENGTGIPVDVIEAGHEDCLEPLNGKQKKAT